MRFVVLIIVCLIESFCLLAQVPDPKKYSSYKFDRYIYSEDFNDPTDTNWVGGDSIFNGEVRDGFWYYTLNEDQSCIVFKPKVDDTRDFQLEFVTKIDKKDARATGGVVIWGAKDSTSMGNYWKFFPNGRGNVFNCTAGEGSCEENMHSVKGEINRHGLNKYTIRKVANTYFFFVNERLVLEWPFKPFYGPVFGVGAISYDKKPAKIVYDYVRVGYLD